MIPLPVIKHDYTLNECQGQDCIYYQGETITDEVQTCSPYFRTLQAGAVAGIKYRVITTTPQCAKSAILGEIRAGIYSRADAAKVEAIEAGRTLRTASARWETIAEEWRRFICPFYHPQT